ncbi:RNA cytosine-C(5)-methyltransferase NSUN2-like [Actinia tenebrosa]|uniref:tRNA (cytosine(34)-C(5))-methyltransferase n=1 Tax=Actinia tenebrosa TaxID=6105 RepID=A0A6P8I1N9_ACTTE|nr:RNA cytosine-C(5)-methyltransferase NSUN2-like [Actinia tenebrosa]
MGKRKRQKFKGRRDKKVWHEITKENKMFEKYYKAQNIIPEEEWDDFMATFKKDLPSTIRITGTRSQSKLLLQFLKKHYLENLSDTAMQGEKVEPPKTLPWYPDELAWQVNLSRKFLRKSATMEKFHYFLVQETECGNISRQEAVSMIPPLLLDVQPGHKVLDTCAAPGSKTSQIIEMLHTDDSKGIPVECKGFNGIKGGVAGVHLHLSLEISISIPAPLGIIGDGTLRKNTLIWNKWTPQTGLSLHRIQLRILARAVEMLDVGGRIVYSTCSLNPVENEAVIAQLLKNSDGAVELLDVSKELPDLKRSPGLYTWKLMMKSGEEVTSCEPGSEAYKGCFRQSHFPPSEEEAKAMNLERCIRVYPHQQDTGGFFIAVLIKKKNAPWENVNRCNNNPKWLPWQTEGEGQPRNKQGGSEPDSGQEESEVKPQTEDAVDDDNNIVGDLSEDVDEVQGLENDGDDADDNDTTEQSANNAGAVQENQDLDNEGKPISLKPPRKKQKTNPGFKEDPFILLDDNDEQWQAIKEYFGIEASFPSDQLLVRSVGGKKRNIYIVSKLVKQVLECANDNLKIINVGVKAFSRCDSDEHGCDFRIMQEGIDSIFSYVTKRQVFLTEKDVLILLEHDKPFTNKFSESTRSQLSKVLGLGCVLFIYDPKGEYSSPSDTLNCGFHFCGWKAKTSTRMLASRMDKTHYKVLCGIPPEKDYSAEPKSIRYLTEKDEDKEANDDIGFV